MTWGLTLTLICLPILGFCGTLDPVKDVGTGSELEWVRSTGCADDTATQKCKIAGYRLNYEILEPDAPCSEPKKVLHYVDLGDVDKYDLGKDQNFQGGLRYYMSLSAYIEDQAGFDKAQKNPAARMCVTIPQRKILDPRFSGSAANSISNKSGGSRSGGWGWPDVSDGEKIFLGSVPPPQGGQELTPNSVRKGSRSNRDGRNKAYSQGSPLRPLDLGKLANPIDLSASKFIKKSADSKGNNFDSEILGGDLSSADQNEEGAAISTPGRGRIYLIYVILFILTCLTLLVWLRTPPQVTGMGRVSRNLS